MSLQDGVNRKTSDQRSSEVDFSIILHNNILFNDVMGIFPHFFVVCDRIMQGRPL